MHKHFRTIQVTLQLPSTSLAAYDQALQLLRQKLGPDAPDFVTLIQHELAHRDPRMIADDYLESHPGVSGGSTRPPTTRPARKTRPRVADRERDKWRNRPNDPSLN